MNLKELTEAASLNAGELIDISLARRFTNEAINLLASNFSSARVVLKKSFTADKNNSALHLGGLYKVLKVYKNESPTNLYRVYLQDITFLSSGSYEIHYQKAAPSVYAEADSIALSEGFCIGISKYVAARVRLLKNPEDKLGKRLLEEFTADSEKENTALMQGIKRAHKMPAPTWR